MCGVQVRPSEADVEQDIVTYDCGECLTAWHVGLDRLDGEEPMVVVQDESTLDYLVTDETGEMQVQAHGWRMAARALHGFVSDRMQQFVDAPGTGGLSVELTMSPDPQHEGCHRFPCVTIDMRLSAQEAST